MALIPAIGAWMGLLMAPFPQSRYFLKDQFGLGSVVSV